MVLRLIFVALWLVASFVQSFSANEEIDSLLVRLSLTQGREKATTYLQLSETYRFSNISTSLIYGDSAVLLAEEIDDKALKAKVLKSLGVSCYYSGEFDLSQEYYNQALALYRDIEDLLGVAKCLSNIGLVYEEIGNYELSTDYYERSVDIAEQIGDQDWVASVKLNLGNSKFYQGKMRMALNYYYQALLMYKELDDMVSVGLTYNNIGAVYKEWKEYDKSLEYFNKAIEIYKQNEDDNSLSRTLTNVAEIYNFYYGNYDKAQELFEQSLEIRIRLNDIMGIAMLNNDLGALYANKQEYQAALKYFKISEDLYLKMRSETGLVMVYYNMGEFFDMQHDVKKALECYKKSLKISLKIGQDDYTRDNYKALFKCYAALNDYDKFTKYYRLFETGNDTLILNLHHAELAEMEARFKTDHLVKENLKMQKEKEMYKNQAVKYRLFTYGLGGIIALFLIIYFLYIIFRR